MTGTVQRELVSQGAWDLGPVVLKGEEGSLPPPQDFLGGKHYRAALELGSSLGVRFSQALCTGGLGGLVLEGTHGAAGQASSKTLPSSQYMG